MEKTMERKMWGCMMENADAGKIEKLLTLHDPETFWDDVRKFTRKVTSDHSINRWEILADIYYEMLINQ